jgi:hypothetical protein
MVALKTNKLYAPKPSVIPGLGLPVKITLILFALFLGTVVLAHGWRVWLVLFTIWGLLGVAARVRLQRDYNAFRVDWLWFGTKALFLVEHVWSGVTLRSFPPVPDRMLPRGIPPR